MLWTQALLWLIMGIIIGVFFHRWLATVGERHMHVVSIGVCDDERAPHLHIKAVGILDKPPLHAKTNVIVGSITDHKPLPGLHFTEVELMVPVTSALRDDFAACLTIRAPGRRPGTDYIEPFVIEHEGRRLVDIETSRSGYTLHTYVEDPKFIEAFIEELRVAKDQLALPAAAVEAPAEVAT